MHKLILVVPFLLVACADATNSPDGGGDSGPTSAATLTVNSVSQPAMIQTVPPTAGNIFWQINITLKNDGGSAPLPAGYDLFTVTTDQLLVLSFSTASAIVTTPCSQSTSVASGGSFTCNLVFEVPTAQQATTLSYDDKAGDTASAAVPAPPNDCATLQSYPTATACNNCLTTADSNTCSSTTMTKDCNNTSDANCLNQCASGPLGPAYCDCISGCLSAKCLLEERAWMTCLVKACDSTCQ